MATSQIPTDVTDLITLLTSTPARERYEIGNRLVEQLGDRERAYKLFDEAEAEVRNGEEIEELRSSLGSALRVIGAGLDEAKRLIDQLVSDQVYDVEYAESTAANDLRHMVAEASRAVRIAQALQSQIEH